MRVGRTDVDWVLPRAKEPAKLPVMWSQHEIRPLLAGAPDLRARALLKTAYGTGLHVSEAIRRKTTAIDSHRMSIRVEQSKRQKDRYTLLPTISYWICAPMGACTALLNSMECVRFNTYYSTSEDIVMAVEEDNR